MTIEHNDPTEAFEHAMSTGFFSRDTDASNYVGHFMYMGTDPDYCPAPVDLFKHSTTRLYSRHPALVPEKPRGVAPWHKAANTAEARNESRGIAANAALIAHYRNTHGDGSGRHEIPNGEEHEAAVDLLANMMHMLGEAQYANLSRIAADHFEAERAETIALGWPGQ